MQALFLPVLFSNLAKSQKRKKTSCDDNQMITISSRKCGGEIMLASLLASETRIIRVKAPWRLELSESRRQMILSARFLGPALEPGPGSVGPGPGPAAIQSGPGQNRPGKPRPGAGP
jgi:hypothetical protein